MKNGIRRSPLFYVGDKYKLIKEIGQYFPSEIDRFVEPFVGGGSVFLNTKAKSYCLNDIDSDVIGLHKYLCGQSSDKSTFYEQVYDIIKHYGLSCSYKYDIVPEALKRQYVKTYYAKFNKDAFYKLRAYYNANQSNDYLALYILLVYGFNHMLRFNANGHYNLPVGNVDFNSNTVGALEDYFGFVQNNVIEWKNSDYKSFVRESNLSATDFVYVDPPYLITFSEYNKLWSKSDEVELYETLDSLDKAGIRFALSNVTDYKGRRNEYLLQWITKYNVHRISSNYISYHDNSAKAINEILVTNY